jgi:predicted nucleic acid-binding protein
VTTYIDSSALVPIYVPERFSEAARSAVRAAGPVLYTLLHGLEVSNAFESLVGRKLLTRDERRAIHTQLQDDLDQHRLIPVSLDFAQLFADAIELSRLHTAKFLARSLDLLHVAAAHAALCRAFVSADDRQLWVAKATGLKVVDIKRRTHRRRK